MAKKNLGEALDLHCFQQIFWGVERTPNSFSTTRKFCRRGVSEGKSRFLQIFANVAKVPRVGSPRYLTCLGRHIDPKKPVAPQEVCIHTRHTLSETSKKFFFWSTKRQHFDENFFVCALWVQIMVRSASNYFSRNVWSEKIILHTLDTFH